MLLAAGKFRSGVAVVKTQRFLTDGMMTHESDRHEDKPWGVLGGASGQGGRVFKYNIANPKDREEIAAKFSGLKTLKGDCIEIHTPCGGGYCDPLEREPTQVREDVLDDFCTLEQAFDVYGFVLDDAVNLDLAATQAQRTEMRRSAA